MPETEEEASILAAVDSSIVHLREAMDSCRAPPLQTELKKIVCCLLARHPALPKERRRVTLLDKCQRFRLCARPLCVPLTLRGRARILPLTCSPFDQRLHASLPCL